MCAECLKGQADFRTVNGGWDGGGDGGLWVGKASNANQTRRMMNDEVTRDLLERLGGGGFEISQSAPSACRVTNECCTSSIPSRLSSKQPRRSNAVDGTKMPPLPCLDPATLRL